MNCREIQTQLPHYLANEVSTSMRKLIQAHLAGCSACRVHLEESAALQQGLRRRLHTAASSLSPTPDAWERLAPHLELEPAPHQRPSAPSFFQRGLSLVQKPAFAALAIILVLVSAAFLAPPVRAQVRGLIAGWFGFTDPQGSQLQYGTDWGFAPFAPVYIPQGLRMTASMTAGETTTEVFGLMYSSDTDSRFAALIQTVLTSETRLPEGRSINLSGRAARLQTAPEIDLEDQPEGKRAWIADHLEEEGVRRLTWNQDEVQIDLISNLPLEEMVRIASQMVEAPAGSGPLK
jgi:hypothetical protein